MFFAIVTNPCFQGLDRDKPNGLARRQAYIFAYEKDNKKYSAAAELIIDLTDINDNAPYLATVKGTFALVVHSTPIYSSLIALLKRIVDGIKSLCW